MGGHTQQSRDQAPCKFYVPELSLQRLHTSIYPSLTPVWHWNAFLSHSSSTKSEWSDIRQNWNLQALICLLKPVWGCKHIEGIQSFVLCVYTVIKLNHLQKGSLEITHKTKIIKHQAWFSDLWIQFVLQAILNQAQMVWHLCVIDLFQLSSGVHVTVLLIILYSSCSFQE